MEGNHATIENAIGRGEYLHLKNATRYTQKLDDELISHFGSTSIIARGGLRLSSVLRAAR